MSTNNEVSGLSHPSMFESPNEDNTGKRTLLSIKEHRKTKFGDVDLADLESAKTFKLMEDDGVSTSQELALDQDSNLSFLLQMQ